MRRKTAIGYILILLCLLCACTGASPEGSPDAGEASPFTVLFINVGKADAALVQCGGASCLIDTGSKESAPALLQALKERGVEKLDAVFLSHSHDDHTGGLKKLAAAYPIQTLYAPSLSTPTKKGANRFEKLAEKYGLDLWKVKAGEKVSVGSMEFEALAPLAYNGEDENENSLVLRLRLYGKTFLFMGDAQFAQEDTLLSAYPDLKADVLKVGNHGNPDATSDAFAKAVSPAYAVISTDRAVDADSANPRVYTALAGAEIWLTEDYAQGVLCTLGPDGLQVRGLD